MVDASGTANESSHQRAGILAGGAMGNKSGKNDRYFAIVKWIVSAKFSRDATAERFVEAHRGAPDKPDG